MLHRGYLVWALWALTLFSIPPVAAAQVRGPDTTPTSAEALTREQAVEQALAVNPTLAAFARELEAARARRLQADGFDPPTFSWNFEEAERVGSPSRFGNQVLGVEQSIEWFGVRRARKEAAAFGVDAAEALLERVRNRIAARTRKTFDGVLQARAVVELLDRVTTLAAEAVEVARARFRSGTASYVDFLRLRLRREQLQNERRIVLVAETTARRELNSLLGRTGGTIAIRGELTEIEPLPEVSTYLAEAEQKVPTLRLLEYRRAEAAKRYEAVRGGRLPELTVGLGRQRLYDGVSDDDWAGRLGLRLPLPGSDRQRGLEAEALAALDRVADLGQAQRLAVQTRLGQRLDEAAVLARRVEDYRKILLPDAEDQLKAAQQDYRVGRIDALGLIDVFNTYVGIRRDYLETLARLRAAEADLAGFGEDLWEVEL